MSDLHPEVCSLSSAANAVAAGMGQVGMPQIYHAMLVQTMVGHPAAGIRNAGFHALEDMLMALQPGMPAVCAAAGLHVHRTTSPRVHVCCCHCGSRLTDQHVCQMSVWRHCCSCSPVQFPRWRVYCCTA
jgi:hypothetical protein